MSVQFRVAFAVLAILGLVTLFIGPAMLPAAQNTATDRCAAYAPPTSESSAAAWKVLPPHWECTYSDGSTHSLGWSPRDNGHP